MNEFQLDLFNEEHTEPVEKKETPTQKEVKKEPILCKIKGSVLLDNDMVVIERPDTHHDLVPYVIGDKIRVDIRVTEEEDPESYFYLKSFEKKRGMIIEVIEKPTLQYRIKFGDHEAILYHQEVTI